MEIQKFIETFGNDPNIHLLPLPASVRKALNKPEEPESNPCNLHQIAQKAFFNNEYDKFEERKYPEDIEFPDMTKMSEEFQERYGIVKEQIATIKDVVLPTVKEDASVQESKEE